MLEMNNSKVLDELTFDDVVSATDCRKLELELINEQLSSTSYRKVTVIDSMMGSGKTTWAINHMNNSKDCDKFVYVTPYLGEVDRIVKSCPNKDFKTPSTDEGLSKSEDLKELIMQGVNISTTHNLFRRADNETVKLFRENNYTLIIDEVLDVIRVLPIKSDDIKLLQASNSISINPSTKLVTWTGAEDYCGVLAEAKNIAEAGNLFISNDVAFIWCLPPKLFKGFKDIYVLTYLFLGQVQRAYFDAFGITYDHMTLDRLMEVVLYNPELEDREKFKELINIYQGKMNNVGDSYHSLTKTFFDRRLSVFSHIK